MLKKEAEQRQAVEMLCTDMLVPREHLLRKIDAAVNFARIYELVEDLYCEDNGRPSCDPVVLFKLVMIQHLFGIRSLRQTMRDAEVNVAYRWFLGYTMSQQLPHFATISYAFRHRFTAEVIEGVFRWILEEVARTGYLSPEVVFVDGTHIKANANLKKQVKKAIPVAAKRYQEQLDEEIEADRAAHGKKPLKKDDDDNHPAAPGKQKIVTESTTDPESGVFHKGGTWAARGSDEIIVFHLPNAVPAAYLNEETELSANIRRKRVQLCPEEWSDTFGQEFYDYNMQNGLLFITRNYDWKAQAKAVVAPCSANVTVLSADELQTSLNNLRRMVGAVNGE